VRTSRSSRSPASEGTVPRATRAKPRMLARGTISRSRRRPISSPPTRVLRLGVRPARTAPLGAPASASPGAACPDRTGLTPTTPGRCTRSSLATGLSGHPTAVGSLAVDRRRRPLARSPAPERQPSTDVDAPRDAHLPFGTSAHAAAPRGREWVRARRIELRRARLSDEVWHLPLTRRDARHGA